MQGWGFRSVTDESNSVLIPTTNSTADKREVLARQTAGRISLATCGKQDGTCIPASLLKACAVFMAQKKSPSVVDLMPEFESLGYIHKLKNDVTNLLSIKTCFNANN